MARLFDAYIIANWTAAEGKKLGDQSVWIGVAMALGLLLGRMIPGLNTALEKIQVDGVSLPRGPVSIEMVGVGFAWASILSMPYAILAGALPGRKMGVYMGVFNIFIVVPQLLAATVLGLILKTLFNGQAIWALVLGAVSFVLSAASALMVKEHRG